MVVTVPGFVSILFVGLFSCKFLLGRGTAVVKLESSKPPLSNCTVHQILQAGHYTACGINYKAVAS